LLVTPGERQRAAWSGGSRTAGHGRRRAVGSGVLDRHRAAAGRPPGTGEGNRASFRCYPRVTTRRRSTATAAGRVDDRADGLGARAMAMPTVRAERVDGETFRRAREEVADDGARGIVRSGLAGARKVRVAAWWRCRRAAVAVQSAVRSGRSGGRAAVDRAPRRPCF